jgi:predicted CXXCH cytochrome family protein
MEDDKRMKRLLVIVAVAVGVFGFALCAEAAIDNTSHELAAGAQGACSTCHIPHKSLGKRLWPTNMSGQEANFGEVGALCYYCHGTGGGAAYPNAVQNNIMDMTQGAFSHGLTSADIPGGGNNLANATDLPYYNQARIQCTTCHNVHDDVNRPFLRKSYETLCQDCHSARSASVGPSATWGAWGTANVGRANAVGSHPVGSDITGDVSGGASPINFNLTAYIQMIRSAAIDNWSIGGHLSTEGGVMCGSCHAPHGVDVDEAAPAAELFPAPALLVFRQGQGAAEDGQAYNGNGDGNNHLCEACHYTTAATINAATNVAYVPTTWNNSTQGGTQQNTNFNKQPNPGGTAFTHPVDDLGAEYAAGVTAFPTGWPAGNAAGANVAPGPICESCHTPHPAANNAARAAINASNNTPILRDTNEVICGLCHTGGLANHHPTGAGLMTARFTGVSSTGGTIGNGDADLTCGDCHNGSGAHNWAGRAQVGLDNDWVPANNNRGAADVVGDISLPANSNDSCKQCHMSTTAGTAHQSPTKNSGDAGGAVSHTWRSNTGYTDLGEGSHFLGDNVTPLYDNGYFAGSAFNALTEVWDNVTGTNGTGFGGWSRWYGRAGSVGCQSCHEIEPDKNVAGTALLLGYYFDGQTEAVNVGNDPSAFCQGCHGRTPGGGTPHPMTASTIGRAVTAGRATTTLITGAGAYLGAGAPTRDPDGGGAAVAGTSTFPGTDMMNCDSCHQPHDAATSGGTYIYEAPSANVTATTAPTLDANNQPGRGSAAVGLEDANFCNQCHIY